VSGVLVEKNEAPIRLKDDVEPADDADDPERDGERRNRAGR